MRTLPECYKLVYQTIKANGHKNEPQATIVWLCFNNILTSAEYTKVLLHFRKNKPTATLHPEFYKHPYFGKNTKKQDWWNFMCKETRQQQRLFIKKMIRITRNRK